MSSVQCSHCQRWFSNHRNLMYHMASCPAKYSNNDDSLELLGHNPLKSSYDRHTSTNVSVPCFKNDTAFLFEVERNEIEGFDDDISSQLATDDSDSDTDSPYDPYDNDYDEESCNPQAQLSTAVSKVQIKLNNLINNHKASLKLHDDIVDLFNEYIASPNFDRYATLKSRKTFIRSMTESAFSAIPPRNFRHHDVFVFH